jgi:DNA-directed RNA polymerase specialized sigma24 family protein
MLDGKKSQVSRSSTVNAARSATQQQVRLSDTQQAELVQRHLDGAFKKELARAYGVHVETVRAIIRRHA